jgi:hypothetical protein
MMNSYHMGLLESRAKRLNELLEIAAPTDMIYKEVMLLTEAAKPLAPKSWTNGYGKWGPQEGQNDSQEEYQSSLRQCATG